MDIALRNSLDALRYYGALNLPDPSVVEAAPDGSRWHGKKKDRDRWMLIKHKAEDYNVEF